MKTFISWSGLRSKYVADALRNWIPKVLQAVRPWMSEDDISTGTRWSLEISKELEQMKVGIICLTPENQHSPWIMFEAGSLSKSIAHSFVCPYLIGLAPSQVSGPMAQFQAAEATREGTSKILHTLNRALSPSQLTSGELDEVFEVWWPRLEQQLSSIPATSDENVARRSSDDLLEEIVQNTREQLRREEIRILSSEFRDKKLDNFIGTYESMVSSFTNMSARRPTELASLMERLNALSLPQELKQGLNPSPEELIEMSQGLPEELSSALPELITQLREMQKQSKEETKQLLHGKEEPDLS